MQALDAGITPCHVSHRTASAKDISLVPRPSAEGLGTRLYTRTCTRHAVYTAHARKSASLPE